MTSRRFSEFQGGISDIIRLKKFKQTNNLEMDNDKPNYMKAFLTQLQQDPETYSLFMDEA